LTLLAATPSRRRFEFQTVQFRTTHSLVLNEHLKRAAHAIGFSGDGSRCETPGSPASIPRSSLSTPSPIRKLIWFVNPSRGVLASHRQKPGSKNLRGRHILLADANEWIFVRPLLEVAKERAVLPLRPIEILRRMP